MDKQSIEREARRLQLEVWNARGIRYPLGVPDIPVIFDPRNVAEHCGLYYLERDRLDTDFIGGGEAAGVWRRDQATILVSTRFEYEVQRFTGAHELGHFVLHPHVGGAGSLHRERSFSAPSIKRPQIERDADYFASCLLMPSKAVVQAFQTRFGTKRPLALSETVAFYLNADVGALFSQPRGSLMFAKLVARAEKFGRYPFPSMARHFGVSAAAMAIRLEELDLVAAYLEAGFA